MMIVHVECFATGRGNRMINHHFDATFGDPGSPILVRDGDKIVVGALNAAIG